MKKNLYYEGVFKRKNAIKRTAGLIFIMFASMPRLLLEVFIRKNFGERYFSLPQAIVTAILLLPIPIGIDTGRAFSHGEFISRSSMFFNNITWYVFLAGFIYFSLKRQKEIKREPSVFDFAKFSLSTGIINPSFYAVDFLGRKPDPRFISTVIEPLFFLTIGLVLTVMAQKVGMLLIICSLLYSASYFVSYNIGDHFIMDTIDEMICNEELVSSFVDGRRPDQTRGFDPFCRRPADKNFRRKIADQLIQDDQDDDSPVAE